LDKGGHLLFKEQIIAASATAAFIFSPTARKRCGGAPFYGENRRVAANPNRKAVINDQTISARLHSLWSP
jgi:hypothetical protein